MKRNRNGISLFLKRKIAFFETENHWPYSMGRKLHVQNSGWDHSLSGNRLIDSPRINTFKSYQCQHQLSIILTHAPDSRRSRIYLRINYYTGASMALENNILLKRRYFELVDTMLQTLDSTWQASHFNFC